MDFLKNIVNSFSKINAAQNATKNKSAIPPGRMREAKTLEEVKSMPDSPGIYRHVRREDNKAQYIGETKQLKTRQLQHIRSGKLDLDKYYVGYAVSDKGAGERRQTEIDQIDKHKPEGNGNAGGGGRKLKS